MKQRCYKIVIGSILPVPWGTYLGYRVHAVITSSTVHGVLPYVVGQ